MQALGSNGNASWPAGRVRGDVDVVDPDAQYLRDRSFLFVVLLNPPGGTPALPTCLR